MKILKSQIKAENQTELPIEETTSELSVETETIDTKEVEKQTLSGPTQSKKKEDGKIHQLTIALRNLTEKSRFLREAIKKQRKLLQADILALRKLRRKHLGKQENAANKKTEKKEESRSKLESPKQSNAIYNLDDEKRKLIQEWLDIEKNSLILGNTAKAFLEKLEAEQTDNVTEKPSEIAAQVVLGEDEVGSAENAEQSEADETGVDTFDFDDPSILALDDPSILIDEEGGDVVEDSEYDYPEIIYDIEYEEDDIIPEIEIEYEVEEDIIEYEDTPVVLALPTKIPPIRPSVIRPGLGVHMPRERYPVRVNVHYRPTAHYPANPHYRPTARYPKYPRPRPILGSYPSYPRYPQHSPLPSNPPHITLTGSLAKKPLNLRQQLSHRQPKNQRLFGNGAVPGHNPAFSDLLG